jgi:hypothetical protein
MTKLASPFSETIWVQHLEIQVFGLAAAPDFAVLDPAVFPHFSGG